LTAATALAKERPEDPPQLVYVPEHGVSVEQIVADVGYWYRKLGYCVVAVSEGLKDDKGAELGSARGKAEVDAFGHARKGGVLEVLEEALKESLGIRARCDKPGYLQRSFGALMSSVDRDEAYAVGRAAVRAAVAAHTDKMVTLVRRPGVEYTCDTGLAPLSQIANVERKLPVEFVNETHNGVTQAFIDYAQPLIGGPLIHYARLTKNMVPKIAKAK
jgi:ATP-dependent phosphofructokinase / diphosphate-dependent phosphofructokinase